MRLVFVFQAGIWLFLWKWMEMHTHCGWQLKLHYTDTGNISITKRQHLGKAWSVHVVKHILQSLKLYFECELVANCCFMSVVWFMTNCCFWGIMLCMANSCSISVVWLCVLLILTVPCLSREPYRNNWRDHLPCFKTLLEYSKDMIFSVHTHCRLPRADTNKLLGGQPKLPLLRWMLGIPFPVKSAGEKCERFARDDRRQVYLPFVSYIMYRTSSAFIKIKKQN